MVQLQSVFGGVHFKSNPVEDIPILRGLSRARYPTSSLTRPNPETNNIFGHPEIFF